VDDDCGGCGGHCVCVIYIFRCGRGDRRGSLTPGGFTDTRAGDSHRHRASISSRPFSLVRLLGCEVPGLVVVRPE
jgi:hypothetical protein